MNKMNNEQGSLVCEKINRLGSIQLNNPANENKFTFSQYEKLNEILDGWRDDPHIYAYVIHAKDNETFSIGTAMDEVYAIANADKQKAYDLFKLIYEIVWKIECYSKPVISLVNGNIHGAAVHLGQNGTHCIAGENYDWAIPGVKQGFFPDAAIAHLMASLHPGFGLYLSLTGRSLNRADALYLGLIEHCIDSEHFKDILDAVEESDPIDPVVDNLHQHPGESHLQDLEQLIGRIFSLNSVEEIIKALQDETGEHEQWAKQTTTELLSLPPLGLKVTFEAIKRAKNMLPEQNLTMDYELAHHFLGNADFNEANRPQSDQESSPNWHPSKLEDVTNEMVKKYFEPISTKPLNLPPRELGLDK